MQQRLASPSSLVFSSLFFFFFLAIPPQRPHIIYPLLSNWNTGTVLPAFRFTLTNQERKCPRHTRLDASSPPGTLLYLLDIIHSTAPILTKSFLGAEDVGSKEIKPTVWIFCVNFRWATVSTYLIKHYFGYFGESVS